MLDKHMHGIGQAKVIIVYIAVGLSVAAMSLLFRHSFGSFIALLALLFSLGGILFHLAMKRLKFLWPETSSSIFFAWVLLFGALSMVLTFFGFGQKF